jgi:hypothetical protein
MVLSLFLQGCNFVSKDVQLIELDMPISNELNDKIVKSLMHYSWSYYIHNLDSLTPSNVRAVQIGWTPGDSVGEAKFRVFYVLNSDVLSSAEVQSLKLEFSNFIPKLAKDHLDKLPFYEKEAPLMMEWIRNLNNRSATDIYNDFSTFAKKSFDEVKLKQELWKIQHEYGAIANIEFQEGQYYRAYAGVDEHVIFYYVVTFGDGRKSQVKLSFANLLPGQDREILGVNFSDPVI